MNEVGEVVEIHGECSFSHHSDLYNDPIAHCGLLFVLILSLSSIAKPRQAPTGKLAQQRLLSPYISSNRLRPIPRLCLQQVLTSNPTLFLREPKYNCIRYLTFQPRGKMCYKNKWYYTCGCVATDMYITWCPLALEQGYNCAAIRFVHRTIPYPCRDH